MARPREFDIDKACEDAMNVFWAGGYKETSLPDLLDGLKLSKGSLYKAFGSKKNLFVEALRLYDEGILQPGVALLRDREIVSGGDRISQFFSYAIARVEEGDHRGCLLCNAAVGAAYGDGEIGAIVRRMIADLTDGFAFALGDTLKFRGAGTDDRAAKADNITTSYVGLRVLARSGASVEQLRNSVDVLLRELSD